MDNEEKKDETVKISLDKESADAVDRSIRAGDLITANEYGYHRGYMCALRHVGYGLIMIMLFGIIFESTFGRD